MAKITQGSSFAGVVNYVLNRDEASIIGYKDIRLDDKNTIIHSFDTQARLGKITKPVAHISLDFSAQDKAKLTNEHMMKIANEYLKQMKYTNTQVLIVRHTDREHPHIHLVLNRINCDGKTISDKNERLRSTKICKELTLKHGLYMSSGKENVKRDRLREPDATKYKIYDALIKNVPLSKSWKELLQRLKAENIDVNFKTKGSTSQIEGVRFTANNLTFNGSKVDRQFSYSKIDYAIKQNNQTEQQNQQSTDVTHSYSYEQNSSNTSLGASLGGLLDFSDNPAVDPEEESFRKRMQRKQRTKGRKF